MAGSLRPLKQQTGACAGARTPESRPQRLPDFSAHRSSVVFMKPLSHSTVHPRRFIFSFALFGRSLHKWNRAGCAIQDLLPSSAWAVGVTRSWRVPALLRSVEVSAPSRFLFPFSGFAFPLAFGEELRAQILQVSCHLQLQGRPILWPKPSRRAGLSRWCAFTGGDTGRPISGDLPEDARVGMSPETASS